MRVLYAGYKSGTTLSRFNALRGMEPEAEFFAIDPYLLPLRKWHRRFETLTFRGPRHRRINADLLRACERLRPDVVWVDKSTWVWPSTLRAMRGNGAFLVHHVTDALFSRHRKTYWWLRLLRKALPLYDLNFTSNVDDHAWLLRAGVRAELTYLGYDPARFDGGPIPPETAERWKSSLLFAGHYEPRTERGILALIEAGLPVTVYGFGWYQARHKERLEGSVRYKELDDMEYVCALKSAKIGLCFVSELNYNQTAGRSFEIPACGTFLLAIRTRQHLECYKEGVEAEFFGDERELVNKARFYLDHEEKRREIARRGHERCVRCDYSWDRYMRDDWAKVIQALNPAPGASQVV